MPANWIVLSAQGDRCPLTTGLRNARHDHALFSMPADAQTQDCARVLG